MPPGSRDRSTHQSSRPRPEAGCHRPDPPLPCSHPRLHSSIATGTTGRTRLLVATQLKPGQPLGWGNQKIVHRFNKRHFTDTTCKQTNTHTHIRSKKWCLIVTLWLTCCWYDRHAVGERSLEKTVFRKFDLAGVTKETSVYKTVTIEIIS